MSHLFVCFINLSMEANIFLDSATLFFKSTSFSVSSSHNVLYWALTSCTRLINQRILINLVLFDMTKLTMSITSCKTIRWYVNFLSDLKIVHTLCLFVIICLTTSTLERWQNKGNLAAEPPVICFVCLQTGQPTAQVWGFVDFASPSRCWLQHSQNTCKHH